jgi:isopentenyl-diphosphate delta-isomerase type 2
MVMSESTTISERKAKHLEICLDPSLYKVEGAIHESGSVSPAPGTTSGAGFEAFHFSHRSMPELDASKVDTSVQFLGRTLALPVFISCMTGGSDGGFRVNRELAKAAGILGIPVGTGSVRVLLDHPELDSHFALKKSAPGVPLLANIGAVQVRDLDPSRLDDIVRRLDADALVIHLNPGQELFQPDGDRDFRGVRDGIARFISRAPYPVIVKETGFGIAPDESRFFLDAGAAYVDIAGAGGTNWISVESYRDNEAALAAAREFDNWGYPTARLLVDSPVTSGKILASGGIRTGMDVAKALALGAVSCGLALPLARAAHAGGADAVVAYIRHVEVVLRTVMVLTGSQTVAKLRRPGTLLP